MSPGKNVFFVSHFLTKVGMWVIVKLKQKEKQYKSFKVNDLIFIFTQFHGIIKKEKSDNKNHCSLFEENTFYYIKVYFMIKMINLSLLKLSENS